MNFVMDLSECRKRIRIYKHILMIVDRLIKKKIYELMDSIKTENLLETLHRRVFSCYGLFSSIVNDRERQMMFKLWQKICEKFGINSKLSSTHHSETDDQMENANKVMKNYLKTYVNYAQNDWVDLLPDVEFAANNHENAFTKLTSFFVDHGYHPRSETKPSELYDKCETRKVELIKTDKIVAQQESIRFYLKKKHCCQRKTINKNTSTRSDNLIRNIE